MVNFSWTWGCFLVGWFQCGLVLGHSKVTGSDQLRHYEYVYPRIDFLNTRPNESFTKDSKFRMSVTAFNKTLHLLLTPNRHLIHPQFNTGGKEYLVYSGDVYDSKSVATGEFLDSVLSQSNELGWASIMVQVDEEGDISFDGSLSFEGTVYNIRPIHLHNLVQGPDIPRAPLRRRQDRLASSFMFRTQDLGPLEKKAETREARCESIPTPNQVTPPQVTSMRLQRRDSGCSANDKIVYMVVAADCSYISKFRSDHQVRAAILKDWNTVSAIYMKNFGVQLGIIDIIIPKECNTTDFTGMEWISPCTEGYELANRLLDFSIWVDKSHHPAGILWHLVSACPSSLNVGLAYKSSLCSNPGRDIIRGTETYKGNLAVAVSSITNEPWKVIAHEIGHNFGADHDCDSKLCQQSRLEPEKPVACCKCSNCDCDGRFLMSPSATQKAADFSPCSKDQICRGIDILGKCLTAPGSRKILTLNMCGNGIKEEGEDCDCGGEEGCKGNRCCDSTTCKFKEGATCDDKNDRCCDSCRPKPKGVVCRPSRGFCDYMETCDGAQGACPEDKFRDNGVFCGNWTDSELFCAQGRCTSRNLQCKEFTTLLGNEISRKACPDANTKCKFQCASGESSCSIHPGNFADGTRCGRNLYCNEGQCEGKLWDKLIDLGESNLMATIMILIGLGFFVMTCLFSCVFRGTRRYITKTPNPPNNFEFPDPPHIHFAPAERRSTPRPRASLASLSPNRPRPVSRIPLVPHPTES